MLTETIAICPKCKSGKAFRRYGSEGYFTFIACPLCGLIEIDSRFPEHNTKKSKITALKWAIEVAWKYHRIVSAYDEVENERKAIA